METLKRVVRKVRTRISHHGLRGALRIGALAAIGHNRWLRVLRGHCVHEINPKFLDYPREYGASFVRPDAVATFALNPETGMSERFVRNALAKGDKCYGFTHEGGLSSYGWYATNPTLITPELRLHFSRQYVYMYKGFTHELHRGKRLFPYGMTRVLRHYRAAGYNGLLLYVDANNLGSLKACARMGFRVFGSIYIAKLFGWYFVYETPGCARFGFRIEVVAPDNAAPRPASSYKSA
jgi:hypothetical protein